MQNDFTEVPKKTMFKKTGWKLLLVLAALIWSAAMPAVSSAAWTTETVKLSEPANLASYNSPMGRRAMTIDSSGHPHTVYGIDHLYHAYFDGTQWQYEVVDNASSEYASIAIDSNDNVHISYHDETNSKYATNASGVWVIESVDTGRNMWHTSIAIDSNNNVHISYYDSTNYDLKYVTNTSGSWVTETVDPEAGSNPSIAIDSNNNVHIIYLDTFWYYSDPYSNLKYATNTSGSWVTETLDIKMEAGGGTNYIGIDNSIAIDSNDNVHISYSEDILYYDRSRYHALKYATNASGAWEAETVDPESEIWSHSISIDSNDNVHISYYVWGRSAYKYATNASGSWSIRVVDSREDTAQTATSIAIDSNDSVHISYLQGTSYNNSQTFKYATNASGSWVIRIIDGGGMPGEYSSIAIDSNNNMHISFFDSPNYALKHATNASGSWMLEAVDTGDVGWETSIAIDSNKNVHIIYHDRTNNYLNYTTNASGLWMVETVDRYWIDYAGVTSIAIDSYDNVHISYGYANIGYQPGALRHATNVPDAQNVPAEDAYDVLITDPTAVMFDVRTVDEHNGYCLPWTTCGGQINTDPTYVGTPQWTIGGVEKLPITLPYWYAGITRDIGPPEDEAQVRNIIEGALAANIIDFDTPIYFIDRTAYRSYHMVAWMNAQTFTNPATGETAPFTNLLNIDSDKDPGKAQGGMQEWNASGLPIFDGTIVPPQVFSGYPENDYIETSTNDVIFVAVVLEPTTSGFIDPDVTEVLLYVDGSAPVSMTQVDEVVLRAFFSIPDDVVLPGKVYMATKYMPDGVYTWNVRATNSAGASWNLHVLNGSAQGPGQRTLTVDACSPSGDDTDCNGRDDDCDGIPDNNYLPTETTCGVGVCAATGLLTCNNGIEVDSCVETEPTGYDFDCDGIDNNCDGIPDNNYLPTDTTCGLGVCAATGQTECIDGAEVDTCAPLTPA